MLKAMLNAVTNLFKPVHTINYPAEPIVHPERYRGLIEYGLAYCIFCDKCEKVCPPGSILFYHNMDGTKKYHYNPYLCIYCGECVRACPKPGEALWQSETKPLPATGADDVNRRWFEMEEAVAKSKAEYAAFKQAEKMRKAAEKKSDGNETEAL
jgi:NADH-quinone oxidoreductase subunit I